MESARDSIASEWRVMEGTKERRWCWRRTQAEWRRGGVPQLRTAESNQNRTKLVLENNNNCPHSTKQARPAAVQITCLDPLCRSQEPGTIANHTTAFRKLEAEDYCKEILKQTLYQNLRIMQKIINKKLGSKVSKRYMSKNKMVFFHET
jgi:hypothetical protein